MPYNYNQDTGEVEPYLFTAWEWVDDAHTQIKCTVREGVIASDGSVFNADDVYFSLKEYKEMGGSQFIELVDIEKTEVVDEYNIIIYDISWQHQNQEQKLWLHHKSSE